MKVVRLIITIILLAFLLIQFFPTMRNDTNEVPTTDILQSRPVPSHVATLVKNACYDCHSNHTEYPWYDKVQPFAWVLEGHIQNAKRKLNFNEFETYSKNKKEKKLKNIIAALKENQMPLKSYKLMHAEGRLSKDEKASIINWAQEELKELH